jgi:hypothetical protein
VGNGRLKIRISFSVESVAVVVLTCAWDEKHTRGNRLMHPSEFQFAVAYSNEGPMRFSGQASRSNKFAILWAADNRNKVFLAVDGYLRKLA